MSIFKAYDIRGIVPGELNADLARRIGNAYANFIRAHVDNTAGKDADPTAFPTICVGRDARPSGDDLVPMLIEGLTRGGCNVVELGTITTPMLYFGVGSLGLDGGVMATASHNPAEYNGFKFTREDAIPVSSETGLAELEANIKSGSLQEFEPAGSKRSHDLTGEYATFVKSFLREPQTRRLKVAVDTANGMAGLYVDLLTAFNIDVVPLYFDIDCRFPNHEANPLKAETLDRLREVTQEQNCDLGVAFDGDADRCVCVDGAGGIVRSDIMTALLAREFLEREPGATILYDLRSSRIVPKLVEELGGRAVRVRVGHSFAKAALRKEKALFGGELSGHCYFRDCYHADSAIVTMVEVLNMLRKTGKSLKELVEPLLVYHASGEINFPVTDKEAVLEALEAGYGPSGEGGDVDFMDGITVNFPDWWFNVRPSNTEPLLRLTMECATAEALATRRAELEAHLTAVT